MAAALALAAADQCANLNIQVHGASASPGSTTPISSSAGPPRSRRWSTPRRRRRDVTDLVRGGTRRARTIDLPPEAEPLRDEVRAFAERVKGLDAPGRRAAMIETGYVMPHWPKPWGATPARWSSS